MNFKEDQKFGKKRGIPRIRGKFHCLTEGCVGQGKYIKDTFFMAHDSLQHDQIETVPCHVARLTMR